jgi:hypothetical protein
MIKLKQRLRETLTGNLISVVLCFDLENAIPCPRAEVSNLFYKRKINVYNLTAHYSMTKKGYNAVCNEMDAGRGGNEIASALVPILKNVLAENDNIEKLFLWSDSCVPQNKNSFMVTALKIILHKHPNLKEIEHKSCCPEHSSIQEVDNIHSSIEKALKVCEVYSPPGFDKG